MKNTLSILFLSIFLFSCQQTIKPEDVSKINGYWEIQKVVFDGSEDKDYAINESYDYFEIGKDRKGFRKKVMPQLDGTFLVNNTYENARVKFKDGKVFMEYATPYARWTEELIAISDKELVFRNSENKEYHYKRAESINILGDGKKAE